MSFSFMNWKVLRFVNNAKGTRNKHRKLCFTFWHKSDLVDLDKQHWCVTCPSNWQEDFSILSVTNVHVILSIIWILLSRCKNRMWCWPWMDRCVVGDSSTVTDDEAKIAQSFWRWKKAACALTSGGDTIICTNILPPGILWSLEHAGFGNFWFGASAVNVGEL